jgi:hypothetical protein
MKGRVAGKRGRACRDFGTSGETNGFLEETHLAKLNGSFSRPADVHMSQGTADLRDILWKRKKLLVEEIHIPKKDGTDSCAA